MFGRPHPAEDYLEQVRDLGIVKAAALVMAPKGDLELTSQLNDLTLALGDRSAGFFFPVCSVHPNDGEEALDELRRVAREGARWLKLHPITQDFDVADPRVTSVVQEASRHNIPVLFDAYCPWDPAQPGKFIQLARQVPSSRLILAHAHGPNFIDLLAHEISCSNALVATPGVVRHLRNRCPLVRWASRRAVRMGTQEGRHRPDPLREPLPL